MKKVFILMMLFSVQVFSAELNLKSGDRVVIQANTSTTVTCEGSSAINNCQAPVQALQTRINTCRQQFAADYCLNQFWEPFSKKYPDCVDAALDFCLKTCSAQFAADYCLRRCQ